MTSILCRQAVWQISWHAVTVIVSHMCGVPCAEDPDTYPSPWAVLQHTGQHLLILTVAVLICATQLYTKTSRRDPNLCVPWASYL